MNRCQAGFLVAAAAVLTAMYARLTRPWMLDRGSTQDELTRTLPGDDIEPAASYHTRVPVNPA